MYCMCVCMYIIHSVRIMALMYVCVCVMYVCIYSVCIMMGMYICMHTHTHTYTHMYTSIVAQPSTRNSKLYRSYWFTAFLHTLFSTNTWFLPVCEQVNPAAYAERFIRQAKFVFQWHHLALVLEYYSSTHRATVTITVTVMVLVTVTVTITAIVWSRSRSRSQL
jgi:hypothetical protein